MKMNSCSSSRSGWKKHAAFGQGSRTDDALLADDADQRKTIVRPACVPTVRMKPMALKLWMLLACAWFALGAQPAQKIFPYEYSQEDLPNGLRLITVPTDYPNIVAVYIV